MLAYPRLRQLAASISGRRSLTILVRDVLRPLFMNPIDGPRDPGHLNPYRTAYADFPHWRIISALINRVDSDSFRVEPRSEFPFRFGFPPHPSPSARKGPLYAISLGTSFLLAFGHSLERFFFFAQWNCPVSSRYFFSSSRLSFWTELLEPFLHQRRSPAVF